METAWSSDGSAIVASYTDHQWRIWDVSTGQQRKVSTRYRVALGQVAWSARGILALEGENHHLQLLDPITGEMIQQLVGHDGDILGLAWSPDAQYLASTGRDGRVIVWDIARGQPQQIIAITPLTGSPHQNVAAQVLWSSDSTKIAARTSDCGVFVWEASTGELLATLRPQVYGGLCVNAAIAWSPLENRLALGNLPVGIEIWEMATNQSTPLVTAIFAEKLAWTPDARYLSSANPLQIWDGITGELLMTLGRDAEFGSSVQTVAWSPDGGLLATSDETGVLTLWGVAE